MADGGGYDLLTALPDDVLRLLLARLPSTAEAARTSVLSRRWRSLWTNLPQLRFADVTDLARVAAVLRHHSAPVLLLRIESSDPAPEKIAAVLDLVAPRLQGKLHFDIITPGNQNSAAGAAGIGAAIRIPCFEKATEVTIRLLRGIGIRLPPPSGVFARLTALSLSHCRLDDQSQRDLGGAVSSEGCPSLRELRIRDADVVSNLAIRSESLRLVQLSRLEGIRQLTISAPALTELDLYACLLWGMPMVDILLQRWGHFVGAMPNVHTLAVFVMVYGYVSHSLPLLQYFTEARDVRLSLVYSSISSNDKLLVEAVKDELPAIEILFLRMSPSIRELKLQLEDHTESQYRYFPPWLQPTIYKFDSTVTNAALSRKVPCSSGCICYKPRDWETMNLSLVFLQKVEINNLSGAECQIYFVKRLLRWTPVLKTITLSFDPSVTVSEELSKELLSFSTPEICMEIYLHHDGARVKYSAAN
uniref:F-box domain-containing protein n=1 Tax=Oryza nivara TaxID=4536 RepID=A0A0E0HYC2_ORYNI